MDDRITREILTDLLFNEFSDMSLENFVLRMTNEIDCIVEFNKLMNGIKAGNKISMLFNPHRLNTPTDRKSGKTIYNSLSDKNFISGLSRAMMFKMGKTSELLYQTIQLGINGVQYVNEFPPFISRSLCEKYTEMKQDIKVIDPCAGWGGRMIGIASLGLHYTGFEPATETYKGLVRLAEWLKTINPRFSYDLVNLPYEDADVYEGFYDLAITSPPYYDTELYSSEDTNSCNKYAVFNDWVDGFYHPMINKTMKSLKNKAVFIMNIGSRRYPLKDKLLELPYYIDEIPTMLSGIGGMNKKSNGKESFYIISNKKPVRNSLF